MRHNGNFKGCTWSEWSHVTEKVPHLPDIPRNGDREFDKLSGCGGIPDDPSTIATTARDGACPGPSCVGRARIHPRTEEPLLQFTVSGRRCFHSFSIRIYKPHHLVVPCIPIKPRNA